MLTAIVNDHHRQYNASMEMPVLDRVLPELGIRLRAIREAQGFTQAALARRSGVSVRFLADVERGGGNASILRLAEVAAALSVSLATLLATAGPVDDGARTALGALHPVDNEGDACIALVGLRGAGKSTIGQALAERLGVPFVEVDAAVEERAGLTLAEVFEYRGADHYRALEREVLTSLLDRRKPLVLATGGSVVTDRETWSLLRARARTVWLRASPRCHLQRVLSQGDERPMRGRADALAELKEILRVRDPLYAMAQATIDTESGDVAGVVERALASVGGGSSAAGNPAEFSGHAVRSARCSVR